MAVLKNRAKMSTSTTGTGTITLGSAESGYQTFADAGVANGNVVRYVIEDGSNFEIGTGTYTATGTTLSRTVSESSNSDAAINLSGSATVFIGATAEDIPALYAENYDGTSTAPSATGTNSVAIGQGSQASGSNAIAMGYESAATQNSTFAAAISGGLSYAGARAGNSIAMGYRSTTNNLGSVAIGYTASTSGNYSIALGNSASTGGTDAIALGKSRAGGTDSFAAAIANNTSTYGATGSNSVAIGQQAKSTGLGSVAIGYGNPLAQGNVSFATQRGQATGGGSIAMGHFNTYGFPTASGLSAIVIGDGNTGSATRSVVLGNDSTSSHTDAIVIGGGASSSAADQITLGHTDQTVRISSSYTLPTTDGTNGQVLTTDGSGSVTFADAGGGGGNPDLYRDNASGATTPSATGTNAVAIGSSSNANSSAAIALGDSAKALGSDTLVLQKGRASGSQATSIAVHNNSSAYGSNHLGAVSIGSHAKSTQDYSFALGYYSQANANYAMAFGRGANAGHISSAAIGHNAATTSANQIALGSTSDTVKISGTYTLPTSDGTNGQVLTTDGSGAVTFADAGGGGGTTTTTAGESATTRYIPFVDNSTGTSNETVRVDPALSFVNNSATYTGDHKLTVGQGSVSLPVTIMLDGNNNGGNYTPELLFKDGDTSAGLEQKMGRITFQSADTGANGLARIEANVKGGQDPNDGTRIIFSTINDSGTYAERLRITEGGALQVGTAYTLPTSDGTANQVLTTDGSGSVTFADAGGGGADLYAANESSPTAQPSATGANAVAIGDQAIASGPDSFAIGEHSDATGTRTHAFGFAAVATHTNALALGTSRAFAADATAISIANNSTSYGASSANSIAMGYQAKSTGSTNGSVAIGHNAQATSRETVAIGSSAYATGSGAVALGGYFGTSVQARATGTTSFAVAGANGLANIDSVAAGLSSIAMAGGYAQQNQSVAIGAFAHANVRGKVAWSSYPLTNANGATQAGNYVLSNSTTDATATKLVTDYDWTSAGSINQIVLPNNSVYGFTGTVIAREDSSSTDDFAVWEVKGGAVRGATASTTTLGSYNINKISESTGAANWSIALSADTTNGAVAITVTGEAAHNIRWVATVNTTEVIY